MCLISNLCKNDLVLGLPKIIFEKNHINNACQQEKRVKSFFRSKNVNVNRLLISVTVLGSAGPIRFVVNEDELVAAVIDTTLKSYAHEGRLPVLGADISGFFLYCPQAGPDALSPWKTIGSHGARNFTLCKKPQPMKDAEAAAENGSPAVTLSRNGNGSWKAWFNKSLSLKVSSY